MQAIWKNHIIAEAPKEDLIYIEGNWYFPPESIKSEFFRESPTEYHCPWKGDAQYFDVGTEDDWSRDGAWSYPKPFEDAIETVKKDFSNYVAFTPGVVNVSEE